MIDKYNIMYKLLHNILIFRNSFESHNNYDSFDFFFVEVASLKSE
jgi:hypothetical protein